MIGRRGKLLIFFYVVFLVVLLLMCSTDLVIREPEKEIYQVAVIIEDVRSDNYSNFRKGMDQAAMDFNVDVHFITLYENMDAGQQIELMEREQRDGADALIVVPVDEQQAAARPMIVPVVLVCSEWAKGTREGSVVVDYEKMGEQLAREMMEEIPADSPVLMFTDPAKQSTMDILFLEGAEEAFTADGYNIQRVKRKSEEGFRVFLEEAGMQFEEKMVILAGNQEIMTEVSGLLSDSPAASECVRGLYGRGNTVPILNDLDRGFITGICVTDDFSIGYFSVRAAVQALEGATNSPIVMDSYYIKKEDLREAAYEKLLFPIE